MFHEDKGSRSPSDINRSWQRGDQRELNGLGGVAR